MKKFAVAQLVFVTCLAFPQAPDAGAVPDLHVQEIVFAVRDVGRDWHWYANFGYWSSNPDRKLYGKRGRLCKLDVRSGAVTDLLNDQEGSVRDPVVHYDAKKILFSYRKGDSENFHLYEINVDGTGLRQLTDGPRDDIEPCYLPNGDIIFCSSRCNRWVPCFKTQVAILYRCNGDGSDIRPISSNVEHDNAPAVLPDGRVIYTRWEYVDRSQVEFHHLWTFNPDGTNVMPWYGNMHPGTLMIDAQPIPNTNKVVCDFSPGHGPNERFGSVVIVDPDSGPDHKASAVRISRNENLPRMGRHRGRQRWRDPYPLSEDLFLVARHRDIAVMNANGEYSVVYTEPAAEKDVDLMVHEPRPISRREREMIVPDRTDWSRKTGTLILSDVTRGRNMAGVKPGDIRSLLVLEVLPKPVNFVGVQFPVSISYKQWGTYFIYRILGTVPVEADGSAAMEIPALRSVFFVALDKNGRSVKRMHSFTNVMPGEIQSCVGCHEPRTQTPKNGEMSELLATRRPPSRPQRPDWIPDIIDFPRHIQPLLDKHCVSCHNDEKFVGKLSLEGKPGPFYSHSYANLMLRMQIAHGGCQGNFAPRMTGSSCSPLMKKLEPSHRGVKMSAKEKELIRYWIDAGAPWPGTYAALGSGLVGIKFDKKRLQERCFTCHEKEPNAKLRNGAEMPPSYRSFYPKKPYFPRYATGARNLPDSYFDLSDPENSLFLRAPLKQGEGGLGWCEGAPFKDKNDPAYQAFLQKIEHAANELNKNRRFYMPDFLPSPHYIREMKRYGILSSDADPAVIDWYDLENRYFRSLSSLKE